MQSGEENKTVKQDSVCVNTVEASDMAEIGKVMLVNKGRETHLYDRLSVIVFVF